MDEEECVTGVAGDSAHPLLRAVYLRRLRLTRLLLEGGAYINESDRHGQTPLMVACRTQHADGQSASRAKLLKYLLERGADPNIQDKDGRSALMHACREHAGPELVALLLAGGADLGLEDQSGTSALVYAVTAGDQKVLRLLLDTYKGQGKEVIIITTDSVPSGRARARQYRHGLAPNLMLDVRASQAPASPSEIQIITSPLGTGPGSSAGPHKQVFSFKENQCFACSGGNSNPCSPTRLRGPGQQQQQRWPSRLQQQPLLRLNSEPWLKIPASAGSSRVPPAVADPPPSLPENRPLEHGPPRVDIFHGHPKPDASETERKASNDNNNQSTHHTTLVSHDCFGAPRGPGIAIVTDGLNQSNKRSTEEKRGSQAGRGEEGAGEEALVRGGDHKRGNHTISLPGISSPHSTSHPNLHTPQHPGGCPPRGSVSPSASFCCSKTHGMVLSSLDNIIHRRKLGADHYASDPQLTLKTASPEETQERARPPAECRRLATLRSSTLVGSGFSSSRESLEGPGPAARRAVPWFERRGSGAFLLDHGAGQCHPRSLPPLQLNPQYNHSPVGGGGRAARTAANDPPSEKMVGIKAFVPCAPPGHPKEVGRRALLRRHSMQSEQLKTA